MRLALLHLHLYHYLLDVQFWCENYIQHTVVVLYCKIFVLGGINEVVFSIFGSMTKIVSLWLYKCTLSFLSTNEVSINTFASLSLFVGCTIIMWKLHPIYLIVLYCQNFMVGGTSEVALNFSCPIPKIVALATLIYRLSCKNKDGNKNLFMIRFQVDLIFKIMQIYKTTIYSKEIIVYQIEIHNVSNNVLN